MQKSDCFVISFDESLNDYTQNCQRDILIRYFDHVENRVKVRYLDSKYFGHISHQDLFIQFTQALFKLDINKFKLDSSSIIGEVNKTVFFSS